MAQSVKVNYILNLINTGSQMLFPLLTFPYACRVIEAEGIGEVSFFTSIISYISLFTCLGIPTYAIREIARVRNDIVAMNRTAVEILSLHLLLTVVGYLVVAVLCLTVPQIKENIPLFLLLSLSIFFTAIGCDWFYQGIEDFKYITVRGLIVKSVSVALLFLFVRTKEDLLLYGAYTVVGILGGNLFNFIRLRKYVHKKYVVLKKLHPFRHIIPVLQVFTFSIITSIYLQLNPVLLGFMKDTLAVGYFTASTKLMMLVLQLSTCLGAVMMPRVSHLLAEKKEADFQVLIQKSYDFTLCLSLPLTTGLIATSPLIIRMLCGEEFLPAIPASQILAPIVLMVAVSNVIGMQVLYPKGKINIVILCCGIGAVTDLVLNCCLVPSFSFIGTSVSYLGAELATTLSMLLIGRKYLSIEYFKKQHILYILGCLFMYVSISFMNGYFPKLNMITLLITEVSAAIVVYIVCLMVGKDTLFMQLLSKLKHNP